MRSFLLPAMAGLLTATGLALAQPPRYDADRPVPPHAPRMNRQEAAEIAAYWVRSYLGRQPSGEEVRYWADRLASARTPADTLAAFLASRDYYDKAGGSRSGYLYHLIRDVGHHEPSREEVRDWMQRTRHLERGAIAHHFLRENPANWWPGPEATPPRELQRFYGGY